MTLLELFSRRKPIKDIPKSSRHIDFGFIELELKFEFCDLKFCMRNIAVKSKPKSYGISYIKRNTMGISKL